MAVFGPIRDGRSDIVEFARHYDPQPMHTDPTAAAAGPFGGLIASGWHTVGVVMRVLVETYFVARSALVSPGIDELRWLEAGAPGRRAAVRVTVSTRAVALEA